MGAAKVFFGAHIQVIMMIHIQYGVNPCNGWNADGPGRKAWIYICVIGAVDMEQTVVNAFKRKVLPCKLNGWVGLQGHSLRILAVSEHQTIVRHTCNHRLFSIVRRFFINNTGQGNNFVGRKFQACRLVYTLHVPKVFILFLQPFK